MNNPNNSNNNKKKNPNNSINKVYDALAKRIISDKYVIANILQNQIPEYKGMSILEILPLIDDGDISNRYIKGLSIKDLKIIEGYIEFDSLFTVKDPHSRSNIGIIMNIEAQNALNLTYNLLNRAVFYASRLITMQKNYTFKSSRYNDLKKVYSIWILPLPSKQKLNTINFYKLTDIFNNKDKTDSLINIIFLNVGNNYTYDINANKDILEMCDLLFHKSKDNIDFKNHILKTKYTIIEEKEEVTKMCSLAEGIEYQGIQKGRIEGIQEGITETNINNAINLINYGMPIEDTFKALKLTKQVREKVLEKLSKN